MPPRGRHRRPAPGGPQPPSASAAGGSEVTGKRNTQAKNQRYARPLPVDVAASGVGSSSGQAKRRPADGTKQTWAQWLASLVPFDTSGSGSASHRGSGADGSRRISGDEPLIGYFDDMTCSVWVQVTPPDVTRASESGLSSQNPAARMLWDAGFFGKGSLSRSEPTWRMRKINEERVKKQRQHGMKVFTPEELTALRRRERMHAKIERARLAVKAGTQLPDGIVALGGTLTEEEEKILARRAEREVDDEDSGAGQSAVEEEYGKHIPGLIYLAPKQDQGDGKDLALTEEDVARIRREEEAIEVVDVEWLHLSGYEVFFLAGMLGVLEVRDEQDRRMSIEVLYQLLLQSHLAPPLRLEAPTDTDIYRPDNPFLLSYLAYHHYRSLGWTVKSGIKFCADFLLYKRGPVFGHAEFAVVIIPDYADPEDEASSPFPRHPAAGDRDWVWFSTMNRVQTQVLKTLVLTHVTIPPMSSLPSSGTPLASPQTFVDSLKRGELHTIREVALKRWVPARMRG